MLLTIDCWFQRMHDCEVLKALIPAMGYVFVMELWPTYKNWDNNPYKNNANGLESNHLPPNLFRQKPLRDKNLNPSSGT